eukprot:609722-Rhodomonas_salina.2
MKGQGKTVMGQIPLLKAHWQGHGRRGGLCMRSLSREGRSHLVKEDAMTERTASEGRKGTEAR